MPPNSIFSAKLLGFVLIRVLQLIDAILSQLICQYFWVHSIVIVRNKMSLRKKDWDQGPDYLFPLPLWDIEIL